MAEDTPQAPDTSEKAVVHRVEGIINDALAGRLNPKQRTAVRTAVDRADRVSPSSDQAVGKAIGGGG